MLLLFRRVLLGTAMLCIVACSMPARATAQATTSPSPQSETSASALRVGPAIIEQVLTPGIASPFSVQVKNITNFPLPIKGFVRDMNPEAATLPAADRERLDASKWFAIGEPDFILQPNETKLISGNITAPLRVTPGGHYATIFFQPLVPDVALSPTMAYISARVGVLAFLVVKGDLRQELRFAQALHTERLQRHGPLTFTFALRNSGNVHTLPSGFLRVYNWRGTEVGKLALTAGVILPETTKIYTLEWKTDDIVGTYHAVLDITYGDERQILAARRGQIWIVPWLEIAIISSTLSIGWLIRRKTKRRWRKAWRAFHDR